MCQNEATNLSSALMDDEDDDCHGRNKGYAVPGMVNSDVERCIDKLKLSSGPILFTKGTLITQSNAELNDCTKLHLTTEPICWIKLKHRYANKIKSCCGVYWGSGYILTACHTFEYASSFDIYVFFPTKSFTLVYEALLPNEDHMFSDRDQCLFNVLGNTSPLGKGVCVRTDQLRMNEELYFYTVRRCGDLQMHKCKHITQSSIRNENLFLMSRAGQPGESGNPIFSSMTNKCVGIYRGPAHSYGCASKIEFQQVIKCVTSGRADIASLSGFISLIYRLMSSVRCKCGAPKTDQANTFCYIK